MDKKTITKAQFIKRFTSLCLGRLNDFPQNSEARQILLKALSLEFEPGKTYTEKQINAVITNWMVSIARIPGNDYFLLRRSLIDFGYLSRTPDGASYWREKTPLNVPLVFAVEIDAVRPDKALEEAKTSALEKKQAYLISKKDN